MTHIPKRLSVNSQEDATKTFDYTTITDYKFTIKVTVDMMNQTIYKSRETICIAPVYNKNYIGNFQNARKHIVII